MKTFLLLALAAAHLAAQRVRITETAGIARVREPVPVTIGGAGRLLFASIEANKSRVFPLRDLELKEPVTVTNTGEVGFTFENSVFLADLSPQTYDGRSEDSGTLRALTYKPLGVTLHRTPNRMHWAPSFQRAGARAYTSIATWQPVQKHHRDSRPGSLVFTREGHHAAYPEIALRAEYRFFAGVPYFLFRSVMEIRRPIEMYWLRNQEMTMDDLFTHVAWPGADGRPRTAAFDERKPVLDNQPIPAEVPWVAFFHAERGYGFGAVVLEYSASKTAGAVTSINDGARNGKYWDRRLINQVNTSLEPGDRFVELNAYVLFRSPRADPLGDFLGWERKLRHPLQAELVQ